MMIELYESRIINEYLPNAVFQEFDPDEDMDFAIIDQLYAQMVGWA